MLVVAALLVGSSAAAAAEQPYTVVDGKVDKKTFNGWRRYYTEIMPALSWPRTAPAASLRA